MVHGQNMAHGQKLDFHDFVLKNLKEKNHVLTIIKKILDLREKEDTLQLQYIYINTNFKKNNTVILIENSKVVAKVTYFFFFF